MESSEVSIESLQEKIAKLTEENKSLQKQLEASKENEQIYNETIKKIKKIQSEYDLSYTNSIEEFKKREEQIKEKYMEFEKIIEKQYNENEDRLNQEILRLKNDSKEKDEKIFRLNQQISELKQINSKAMIEYHIKESEYKKNIFVKDRQLEELKLQIESVTAETAEEMQRMAEQMENFQTGLKYNNMDFAGEEAIEDFGTNVDVLDGNEGMIEGNQKNYEGMEDNIHEGDKNISDDYYP